MSQQELLKTVVDILERNQIEYMLTGSVVSSLQGEPRSTHDIDLIISIAPVKIKRLYESFDKTRFYLDENTMHEALKHKGMFNLIDVKSGDKVDFWMITDEPFDQSRFSRKHFEEFLGFNICVSTPEDTILAKLDWSKISGGSEKQFIDALRIYEVQYRNLDMDYLKKWSVNLYIEKEWERLITEADPL